MSQNNSKESLISYLENSTAKVNDGHNSSSSETETQRINHSLRRKTRQRQFTQSFSFNPLPLRIVGDGETQPVSNNQISMRDMTLNAPQIIDDSSDIDVDAEYHISNESSSDNTAKRSIVFPGRSLEKSDFHVKRTIRRHPRTTNNCVLASFLNSRKLVVKCHKTGQLNEFV
ncbi:uncharacterized protein LOC122322579 [Drosophila grimshawi]|uniref:uncharacterized protein LOC122322579 n=1 Tax=Drosophila grimshawi TaxID=7222 RepID=UPI001C9333A1|nr:uncharacterized protein LOC122322579 [Drosophila grimshawi]